MFFPKLGIETPKAPAIRIDRIATIFNFKALFLWPLPPMVSVRSHLHSAEAERGRRIKRKQKKIKRNIVFLAMAAITELHYSILLSSIIFYDFECVFIDENIWSM